MQPGGHTAGVTENKRYATCNSLISFTDVANTHPKPVVCLQTGKNQHMACGRADLPLLDFQICQESAPLVPIGLFAKS